MCNDRNDYSCNEVLDKLVEKTNKLVKRCQKLKEKAEKNYIGKKIFYSKK